MKLSRARRASAIERHVSQQRGVHMIAFSSGRPPGLHLREPSDQLIYDLVGAVCEAARSKRFKDGFAQTKPATQLTASPSLKPAGFLAVLLLMRRTLPEIDYEVRPRIFVPLDVEDINHIASPSPEIRKERAASRKSLKARLLCERVEGSFDCFTKRMSHDCWLTFELSGPRRIGAWPARCMMTASASRAKCQAGGGPLERRVRPQSGRGT
jgi:hypothetical protein